MSQSPFGENISESFDKTAHVRTAVDLNDDIQSLIIDHLDKSDILSLTYVSRRFSRLATPAVYRAASFLLRISQVPVQWTIQEDNSEVLWRTQQKFADVLMRRPDLANYVVELEWGVPRDSERVIYLRIERRFQERMSIVSPDVDPSPLPPLPTPRCFQSTELLINLLSMRLHNLKRVHFQGLVLPPDTSFPLAMCPPLKSVKLRWPSLDLVISIIHSPRNIVELSLVLEFSKDVATTILEWLAEQPFTSLRVLCLRTTRPTLDEWRMKIFAPWKQLVMHCRSSLEMVLLGFHHPMPGCMESIEPIIPPLELGLAEDLTCVFENKACPNLRVLKLEGVLHISSYFSGLEAIVPKVGFEEKRRLVIEKWNPDEEPRF